MNPRTLGTYPPGTHLDEWDSLLEEVERRHRDLVQAERRLSRAVAVAREAGVPWSKIGTELGCSKQTAHNRYGGDVLPGS